MKPPSPEKLLLTRLFAAQRRLRFVRGITAALHWFAVGSVLAAVGLVALWNWDRLPGPWQWLATAGRPAELLWLPLLLALGGFSSRWLDLPSPREAAYKLDQLFQSQERILTAVDWLLSEKPRTQISERLLGSSADTLRDEGLLKSRLRQLEKVPVKRYALLLSLAVPIVLLATLPDHVGLPSSAAVWLSPNQVDNLTENLREEMELARSLENPEQKLKELLERLGEKNQLEEGAEAKLERELQQALDELQRQAKAQETARQLLETLAERARQGQSLQKKDREALEQLRKLMQGKGQSQALDEAAQNWEKGKNQEAAESLEQLQQEAGQSAKEMEDACQECRQAQSQEMENAGQEYDESKGEEFEGEGQGMGKGSQSGGAGAGEGGEGKGKGTGDAGVGTTEEEGQGAGARGNQSKRQSKRTSDWTEEYKNLHPPERTEFERNQTKVKGQRTGQGPRFQTSKEGRGEATQGSYQDGSGGLLEYQESAENALLREEIPADYRDNVRIYFETLDGGR